MGSPNAVPFPIVVAPGQTVDVAVSMLAPDIAGHYEGDWQLESADGQTFGVGDSGADRVWVRVRVIPPAFATATPTVSVPTETSTVVPTATETVTAVPTATAASQLIYDFAGNVCAAQWQSNIGVLPCPGSDGDPNGFVLSLDHASLEDGSTLQLPTILTFPRDSADGYILGVYPEYEVKAGDHLQASVGCEKDATACSVLFRISYLDAAGAPHDIWTLGEFYDGKYFNLDLDLSPEAGQKVKFVLYVGSLGSATEDRALWVAPRLVHFPVPEPTATDTATPTLPPSTATPSPVPTASPAPALVPTSVPATPPANQPPAIQQIFDSIISFFQQLLGVK